MNLIQQLTKRGLIQPPYWLPDNIMMLAIGGSEAYGTNNDISDRDIWGIAFPPRHSIFPHEAGIISGFGTQSTEIKTYVHHHVMDGDTEYDLNIYPIVKFFELARQGNPNIIDFLFVPEQSIIYSTKAGQHLRSNRKLFFSKDMWPRFRGFAFNHIRSMQYKVKEDSKRASLVAKYGYDVKDAGHIVRCCLALSDIMTTGDYDLRRHSDVIRAIRRGGWTYEQVVEWFSSMDLILEKQKAESSLPERADEQAIKKVLMECLEMHYGRLDSVINDDSRAKQMLREIANVLHTGSGAY